MSLSTITLQYSSVTGRKNNTSYPFRAEMQELYNVTTQLEEEVLFQIGYRADITTSHTIKFRGIEYDIVRIDPFEGYKTDLKLYCKRKS